MINYERVVMRRSTDEIVRRYTEMSQETALWLREHGITRMLTRPEIETVETLVQVIDEENEARGIKDKRAREMMIQNLKKGMRTTAAERAAEMR